MHLKSLPRRQSQCPVAVLMGQLIHDKPLCRRRHTAGRYYPQHELESRLQLGAFPLTAQIAVILHVAAVEFQQPVVILRQTSCNRIAEGLDKRPAQIIALQLDMFNITRWSANRLHR